MATTDETFAKDEPVEGFATEEPAQGVKRPADAPNENEDEPPSKVAKANPNSFKNVFKQLSLMRPGLFFEMEKEVNEEEGTTTFTMVVDVDGVKFRGTGPSKRNAKVVAAEQVLAHLESLGVKPREPKEGEVKPKAEPKPKPEAPPASKPLSEEQKALQMTGKNPVMMLHEIRPNFECEIESDERKGAHRKVVISVTVEGQKFVGSGRSNKNARARAAVSALESLFGLSFTEFGENEIPVYLGDEWAWRKFTKRAEKKEQPAAAPGKTVKNAVMQLNDMYKGLEFNVIDRSGPDHCPFFKVSVDIEGQTFEGTGTTKKAAKLSAAEKALDGLALSGVLAQRATQKKQHQWGKQNKGQNFVPAGEGGGAADAGENGSGEGNTEQNGQSSPRGKGRGGRGGRGRGRGWFGGGRGGGGFRGRGGGFRGRGGQNRGRGGGSGGATGSQGWGNQGDGSGNMMRGRGRGGWGRGGGRGGGGGGGGSGSGTGADGQGSSDWTQSSSGMGGMGGMGMSAQTDTTDYSYQDPYTSTDSNTWNTNSQSSYNMFDNSYIDNTYDTSNYGASYNNKSSYDTTGTTGNYDSSYNNSYQADTSNTWSDYGYGY